MYTKHALNYKDGNTGEFFILFYLVVKLPFYPFIHSYSNFSASITTNIIKVFPECYKNNMKTLNNLLSKIENQFDELRRNKTSHRKQLDKYQKVILEIESTIKSRNTLAVTENIEASHTTNVSTAGAARESSTSKDNESFMNSLKQFVKITPIENMKRTNEKIRDLIKELDVMEVQLGSNSKKLSITQQGLIEELGNAMGKLDQIETIRLNNLKEGLNRLYLAEDLLVNRLSEMMALLMTDINNLDCGDENLRLVESIDNYTNSEISSTNNKQLTSLLQCINVIESSTGNRTNYAAPITDIFMKVMLLIEGLDYFRAVIIRSIAIITDLSDIEKSYSKTIAKVLDKHGYFATSDRRSSMHSASYDSSDNTATSVPSSSSNTNKNVNANVSTPAAASTTNKSSDLLGSVESPTMKLAWETIVNVFSDHSEVHSATAEVFHVQIIANFDAVMKHLDIVKKDLSEKYLLYSKKVDGTSTNLQKLSAKLNKVRSSLKDRREAIKQAKDDVETDLPATAANSEKEENQLDSGILTTETNASNNSNGNKYIQGFEKLGTSLRTSKLSVGLGLETAEERVSRIEAKITALEEEENLLIAQLEDAKINSLLIVDTTLSEVAKSIATTKELFNHDITEVKNVLKGIAIRTVENMESSRKSVILLRTSYEAIDVDKDKAHLSEKIRSIGLSSMINVGEVDPGSAIVVFSPLEIFEPTQSDLIDTERQALGITKVYHQEVHHKEHGINSQMPKIIDDDDDDNSKLSEMKASDLAADNPSDIVVVTGIAIPSNTSILTSPVRVKAVSPPTSSMSSPAASTTNKGLAVTNNTDFELAKFGLSISDRILESYTCAVYPKKSFLIHGRMYVTQHYIAFSGWPETRILIRMSSITLIEKMNTLNFIPNAISIKTNDDDYFFASFIDRDPCYKLISSMSELDRGLEEQYGPNMANNNLVFGYQTKRDILQAIGMDSSVLDLDFSGDKSSKTNTLTTSIASPISSTIENAHAADTSATSVVQPSVMVSTVKSKGKIEDSTVEICDSYLSHHVNDIDFSSFFKAHDIIALHEQNIPHAVDDIWNGFWLDSDGYFDFLTSEGDLDIKCDEWSPFNQNVDEDVANIKFTHYRRCDYAHPRTTMLMFGPKNAPATQTQYLYLLGDSNTGLSNKKKPVKAIILTVTQFDQIPLADCFKVCQYWLFEDREVDSCAVRIGIHIHFIKSTLLRGQVISGSKDELTVLVKKYCAYLDGRITTHKSTLVRKSDKHADPLYLGSNSGDIIAPPRRNSNSNRRLSGSNLNLNPPDTAILAAKPEVVTWRYRIIQSIIIILVVVILFQYFHNYLLKQNITSLTARVDELMERVTVVSNQVKELSSNSNIVCESKVSEQL